MKSDKMLIELREEFEELFPKDQEAIDGIRPSKSNRSAALVLFAKFSVIIKQVKDEALYEGKELGYQDVASKIKEVPCAGCKDGHKTMWHTLITSPEWALWKKEVGRRMHEEDGKGCFDVDESEGLGCMSKEHFSEFISFCKTLK